MVISPRLHFLASHAHVKFRTQKTMEYAAMSGVPALMEIAFLRSS